MFSADPDPRPSPQNAPPETGTLLVIQVLQCNFVRYHLGHLRLELSVMVSIFSFTIPDRITRTVGPSNAGPMPEKVAIVVVANMSTKSGVCDPSSNSVDSPARRLQDFLTLAPVSVHRMEDASQQDCFGILLDWGSHAPIR